MKYDIRLNSTTIFKKMLQRVHAVSAAPATQVKPLNTYPANHLAQRMCPHTQHFIIKKITTHSRDCKTFVFAPDVQKGTNEIAWFSAGQYLVVHAVIDGRTYKRPYYITSAPQDSLNGEISVCIKRVDGGIVSGNALDSWQEGDSITTSPPLGNFTYEPLRDARTIIGIADDIGIAPFLSLAGAVRDGDEDCKLTLLYSACNKDAVLTEQFETIAKTSADVKLINVFGDEEQSGCEHGSVTAQLIQKYAPKDENYSLFTCGQKAFLNAIDPEIKKLGLLRKFIRTEQCSEIIHPNNVGDDAQSPLKIFQLKVIMSEKERLIDAPAEISLLRAMENAGINPPSACRTGKCGWCHSQLISGNVYIPKESDDRRMADKEFGYIHPCCSFPLSDIVLNVPNSN